MKHRNSKKKLGRGGPHRKAMIRNLLTSLLEHEAIETTHMRCKVVKREVEKLITLGKRGTLNARRVAASRLFGPLAVQKLFDEIAPRFADRPGGYSRILMLGRRRGDGAPNCIIELLGEDEPYSPKQSAKSQPAEVAEKMAPADVVEEPAPEAVEEPAAEAVEEPAAEAQEPEADEPKGEK